MENPVIIFGAEYLGRAAREIFASNGVVIYGFLDDNKKLHNQEIDENVVLGGTDDDAFLKLIGKKCEAFVAVDDNKVRRSLIETMIEDRKVQPVNAIHKTAVVPPSASLGHGNFIDAGVIAGAGAQISSYTILNAGVILGVESKVGNYVQIGAGSVINPGVVVEEDVFIGSGVTVISGVTIGKGARVGAGSVVISAVKEGSTVFGNPAQPVKS